MTKTKKLLSVGVVGLLVIVLVMGGIYAYLTHGWLWSLDMRAYGRLLHAMPDPPGLLKKTDMVDLTPYHPYGSRSYDVNRDHAEVVEFFLVELPKSGWNLEAETSVRYDLDFEDYALEKTEMLFSYRQRYWLVVIILTKVSDEGTRLDDPWVRLEISKHKEDLTQIGP